jgi:hypothetical protein
MQIWQKYLLYGVILFFSCHLLRDILQTLNIHSIISDTLVKGKAHAPNWYWIIFNSYPIEILGLISAFISLKKEAFEPFGFLTIILAVFFTAAWVFYWIKF